jgi:hypothetical protein
VLVSSIACVFSLWSTGARVLRDLRSRAVGARISGPCVIHATTGTNGVCAVHAVERLERSDVLWLARACCFPSIRSDKQLGCRRGNTEQVSDLFKRVQFRACFGGLRGGKCLAHVPVTASLRPASRHQEFDRRSATSPAVAPAAHASAHRNSLLPEDRLAVPVLGYVHG